MDSRLAPFFFRLFAGIALFFSLKGGAQTFKGTNAPGDFSDFTVQVKAGVTNIALTLPPGNGAYSALYLKKGGPASETDYDYASTFVGQTNYINLEVPQLKATNWHVRVSTPAGLATPHAFTLTWQANATGTRILRPVSKPVSFTNSGAITAGKWNYFRVEMPTNDLSLQISIVTASGISPDLYLQRGALPTGSSHFKRSTGVLKDVMLVSDAELSAGGYFIGLYAPASCTYTLRTEVLPVVSMNFDPGETNDGTEVYTNVTARLPKNFYFKVRTINPSVGAWRTVLRVSKGEADLYLSKGSIPTPSTAAFKAVRKGSDGLLLNPTQFGAGQDWYICVAARTNSAFSLISGAAYVADLGELAPDSLSSTNLTIGPEGWRFFKTTVNSDAEAWRLGLKGATNNIYLKKTSVPFSHSGSYELARQSHLLVVPPYLVAGHSYFIGVPGTPGSALQLESRQQSIIDLDFVALQQNVNARGYGFTTYRVQVPPDEIAWQINVTPISGEPNVYLRRNLVANERYADAFSEVPGKVTDSISLVPPNLSDGTFYITVAGQPTNSYHLQIGRPTITDIPYTGKFTNDEANRVGWRYYRVADIDSQLGSLGWELFLSNFAPGTRFAMRRNYAPSIWTSRNDSAVTTVKSYTAISLAEHMLRSGNQADVWYIGVYNPTNALGKFTLTTRDLPAEIIAGDGGLASRSNAEPYAGNFFGLMCRLMSSDGM